MRVVFLFTRRSEFCSDAQLFLVMYTYFRYILLHFFLMSISCILWMNGTVILFLVSTWRILLSTSVRQSYVEPVGSWRLDFGHVYFVTSIRQLDVEPPGSWLLDFGTLGLWLMFELVSTSTWLIQDSQRCIYDIRYIFFVNEIPLYFAELQDYLHRGEPSI